MNNLKIYYPFKPFKTTQLWGNENKIYSDAGFSFDHHNGIDALPGFTNWDGSVQSTYPVYCPVENFTVERVDFAEKGGGNELWLISNEPVKMFEQECYAYMPLCHGKKVLVPAGYKPELGELLMIADNTGFSTGVHTHMGLYRVEYNGRSVTKYIDTNNANGSFDPSLFFTNEYAIDKASATTIVKSGLRYLNYLLGG